MCVSTPGTQGPSCFFILTTGPCPAYNCRHRVMLTPWSQLTHVLSEETDGSHEATGQMTAT